MVKRERKSKAKKRPTPPRLCDLVGERIPEILAEWERRVRLLIRPARPLPWPDLRDNLPPLLRWIADIVRTAHGEPASGPGALPDEHARVRMEQGYDLAESVLELSLLRQIILERWEMDVGLPLNPAEVRRLNDAIDTVLARSALVFADARRREVQTRLETERELIGIVSHDLRNPLAAIRTSAELLERRELEDRNAQVVVRLRRSVDRAARLVDDLLDFTRARLGAGIPVDAKPADLHEIVQAVLDEVHAGAPEREIEHLREGDGRADLDSDRVAQVVHNLVTNALKYGPPDSVVTLRTWGDEESVCLSVHNRGAPIPPDVLPHVFEPLYRAANHTAGGDRSVGLGLYIVSSLVKAHGGTVGARSDAEHGTTFKVRLPRRHPGRLD